MKWFRDQSVRAKLILLILAVSLIVVFLVGMIRIGWDIQQSKQTLKNEITTLAQLLGDRSQAALVFSDTQLAKENLAVLHGLPHLIMGCLYFANGTLASEYLRSPAEQKCPPGAQVSTEESVITHNMLYVARHIVHNGRDLGVIYLASDLTPIETRTHHNLMFSGIALITSALVAWFLAGWLQGLISKPMKDVTDVARAIERNNDHSLRVSIDTHDEIGDLARSFNSMLDTLQVQTQELTQAKATQENLLARYRDLFDYANDVIMVIDPETGALLDVNPLATERYGYSRKEFLGMTLKDITAPQASDEIESLINRVKREGRGIFERLHRTKDGTNFPVEVSSKTIMLEGRKVILSYVRDLTERKRAEENARRLSQAIDQNPNAVIITDTNGIIEYANLAFTRLTGYPHDEIIGRATSFQKSGQTPSELYEKLWSTINAGHVWQGELVNRRKDGSLYLEELSIKPLLNEAGGITHFVAVKHDISKRRQSEEVLRRAQKMDAIGHLAGGIAHDFNNQLGVVIGYLDFLESYLAKDNKAHQWVETATQATLRCMDLTRQLLIFSRRQKKEVGQADINGELNAMDKLIARSITPAIILKTRLAQSIWPVALDAGEFQDAILNLVINARDAMPEGGSLSINTKNIHVDEIVAAENPGLDPGDYVLVSVCDTGQGMDKTVQEHAFEPFFSTKPKDKGSGLGLAMVYSFVERYGGHIVLDSKPGSGTDFRLYFPRSLKNEDVASESVITEQAELPSGSETILVVDDETALLDLAVTYLSELGYKTLRAEQPAHALMILRSGEKVDLVFTDIVMPGGINGYELAKQIAAEFPATKILLTSGFTENALTQGESELDSSNILQKPYRKDELALRVRRTLDNQEKP